MKSHYRILPLYASVILLTALVPVFGCPAPGNGQGNLEAKLAHVTVQNGEVNGLAGPHFIIEGANVHVRSGSGSTSEFVESTGLGNLIIGYNEEPTVSDTARTGSHNLVAGIGHNYTSTGGFVAGEENLIATPGGTVSGGGFGQATGINASVSGGEERSAMGFVDWAAGSLEEEQ